MKDARDFSPRVFLQAQDSKVAKSSLKNISGLLLVISRDFVYLLHETVSEFLQDSTRSALEPTSQWMHFDTMEAEKTMARVCNLVLNMLNLIIAEEAFISKIYDFEIGKPWNVLLESLNHELANACSIEILVYATSNWPSHATHIAPADDPYVFGSLAHNLLVPDQTCCVFWYLKQETWERSGLDGTHAIGTRYLCTVL